MRLPFPAFWRDLNDHVFSSECSKLQKHNLSSQSLTLWRKIRGLLSWVPPKKCLMKVSQSLLVGRGVCPFGVIVAGPLLLPRPELPPGGKRDSRPLLLWWASGRRLVDRTPQSRSPGRPKGRSSQLCNHTNSTAMTRGGTLTTGRSGTSADDYTSFSFAFGTDKTYLRSPNGRKD